MKAWQLIAAILCALERSTAVHRDPANGGRRFIPLLLRDGRKLK
ncbi:MAG: hypothetical protein ABJF10_23420 [Chthoniobacter sp.]